MLSTRNLCFGYKSDTQTLKNINLDIGDAQITGLVGANGSGKSTLFMTLLGILKPSSGEVCWEGNPIDYSKKNLLQLRQNVAMVFQDPDQQIFYTDIKNDIAFSLRNLGVEEDEINKRVEAALTLVGGHEFVSQPVQYLSFGQKKRVAIAGALVLNAPCILLDEPTAGLDPVGRTQIIEVLKNIASEGNKIIISSHDIDLIYQICDHVHVLRKGEIISSGSASEVLSQTALIEEAGLSQPWLVKLHLQGQLPLFTSENELFQFLSKMH